MFAPTYERTEDGLLKFPPDIKWRREIWPENVRKHPAKFNIFMVAELVKYMTEEGQRILDPMSGTGTTMMAAVLNRDVVLVEIEEKYHQMQQKVLAKLVEEDISVANRIFLINEDCRRVLPIEADAIIFSPPYGDILKRRKVSGIAAEEDSSFAELPEYSKDPFNLGKLNQFMFIQVMEKVYKQLAESAPLMAVVLKDRIVGRRRVRFVKQNIKVAEKCGWQLVEEVKMFTLGTEFLYIKADAGEPVVQDESIVIMRRK